MNSTWFNIAVVVLWLTTMCWLISQKVVPALVVGEPPSYRTIVEAQRKDPTVGWSITLNQRRVGSALSTTVSLPDDMTGVRMTEVRSVVRFDNLPLTEITRDVPNWLRHLVGGEEVSGQLDLEITSRFVFDGLDRLSHFKSSLRFPPAGDVISVQGSVDGDRATLSVSSLQSPQLAEIVLPRGAVLSDALSPQTQLPDLREGQSWTVEIYSPLRPPTSPEEILQATVERNETIYWNGEMVDAWVVVYRDDPGAGTASARSPRGTLWVRRDGTVLKQKATLLGAEVTFQRLSAVEAAALADTVDQWEGTRFRPR
ncbi:MAG: hypothetical protein ACYTG0_01530 [Planctomycetota bacterium]|jgi:hypothetical protein